MKTLKFMLAAATAIGLASASHAATVSTPLDSEDFESGYAKGDAVPKSGVNGFSYSGAAGDNESAIDEENGNKFLQVSTGTDALLRNIDTKGTGDAETIDLAAIKSLTIDTKVQFTVTPADDDSVVAGNDDKLLVYFKEVKENGVVVSTNLFVKALFYKSESFEGAGDGTNAVEDVKTTLAFPALQPNDWVNLVVEATVSEVGTGSYLPVFTIKVDGVSVVSDHALTDDDDTTLFPSLLGPQVAPTLQYVGFAGEGKVDDIAFSKQTEVTAIDFTLTWPSGYTAVSYTINGNAPVSLEGKTSGEHFDVLPGDVVYFTFKNADGAQKTMPCTAASDATSIAAADATFGWADYLGAAVDGAYQIDDGADLVMLQKGVFAGLATSGETFKQTANIDMTSAGTFYGIGWFESSTAFASVPTGVASDGKTTLPFAGTYDGQGYTISNVTIVKHSYAGVFNNVSGTVRNLTVQDIGLSGTCSEWGCAIVGNASAGSLLENLTAVTSSGFDWGSSANHNVAGIVVRPIGAATIRGCVNNANISSVSKRLGGIASFVGSGTTGTVFDSCTNNATLVSTDGTRGVGGILGCAEGGVKNSPTANDTIIRNCADFGSETAQNANGHAGAIVGSNWNESYTYTDDGGNTFKASTVDCGYVKNAVFGRAYATASTIDGTDYLTTVKAADLAAGGTYTLLQDVAAGTVFTLQAAGDTIAFDTALGYTFAGTVDTAAATLGVSSATAGTVTTYTAFTAVAKNGANKYATFKAAVDAANAGDTVVVLADCAVPASVSFTKNITVSNDYTIAANVNYALCIGATVTFEGSGMIQRGSTISGSAFCVGANETTRGAITAGTAGTLVFNGGTVCGGNGGNQIKLENGTVEMNGGVLKDGLRGIKADADAGSYTSAIVINGGTITNFSAYAVFASAESATGKATITINGGVIAGPVGKAGKGDETITIPGTSTAKFNADQSSFCAAGYETVLSDGWYVVQAVAPAGEDIAPGGQSSTTYNTQADAEAAVANVTVEPDPAITNQLSAAAATAYAGMFEAKVVEADGGGYKIEVGLTAAAEAALQSVVDDAAAEVVADLTETDVELTTTPGFYYSFEYGTSLGDMAEGERTLATGSSLKLERPTTVGATSGFYKVLVNVTDKQ